MPTQQPDLEKPLFRLRWHVGFYDETGKDCFPQFLDSLRPYVKVDERLRAALLRRRAWGDLYVDGRTVLEFLLDELPDSPQPRFVLNYFAFQPLGEDGMSTQSAHRIMAKRCPDDPWFRRQVVQFARGRRLGLGYSGVYYHSDLSDSDGALLLRWALDDPTYLPRCLNGFSLDEVLLLLARHPDFPVEDYDFAGDLAVVPRLLEEARKLPSEPERVGFFACSAEVHEGGQRQLVDFLAEDLRQENSLVLCKIADHPLQPATTWARLRLLENAGKSPLAWDWIQTHLAAQTDDQWWLLMLAEHAPDPQWTLDATYKLLAMPDQGLRTFGIARVMSRLCDGRWRLPPDQVVPLLQRALADSSLNEHHPTLLRLLARAYPHHPDTRPLLLARRALAALRLVDGLPPELVQMALEDARLGSPGPDVIAILRDSKEEAAFHALIKVVEENPADAVKASALRALAEAYGDRSELKSLLIKYATLDEKRESLWRPALFALGTIYPGDPEARETLERIAGSRQRQSCWSKALLDYLADPDYSLWLANQARYRAELVARLGENGEDHWKPCNAAYELALWFGDEEETIELLLGPVVTGERPANGQGTDKPTWLADRVAKARLELAIYCLRLAVMRWRDKPRVHQAVIAALHSPVAELRDEAACLLSRAWSQDPQTVPLLRPLIVKSPVIFGEYMGLRLGEPEAMAEGVAVLERLAAGRANDPIALDGPLHLLRHFGPRKDLWGILARLGARAGNPALQKGISNALDTFFPGRKAKSLQAEIATDRIEALQAADVRGADLARVKAMSEADPSDAVRLAAAEALFSRAPKDAWPVEAVKDLIQRGLQQAIPLLGRIWAGDEAVLAWLLQVINANQGSSNLAGVCGVVTNTVAQSFSQTPGGRRYLVERLREAQDIPEFSTAVRGLCTSYHHNAEIRSVLDSHLLDARLDGPTASHLLQTQTKDWPAQRKIDFYLSVIQNPKAPEPCEAQRVAPGRLGLLIACECHGEIAIDAPEAKRVVSALIDLMEKHPRENVRLHAMSALLTALGGETGKELEARSKLYPEAEEALNRWWAKASNPV
jgi:hypothetical protein